MDERRVARDAMFTAYLGKLQGTGTRVVTYDELVYNASGYKVRVLGGYSGLGYENPEVVKAYLRAQIAADGNNTMYVIGGTSDGIGAAYEWIPQIARELGFTNVKTAGIVSRNAAEWGIAKQDLVVFVDTSVDSWEVIEGGRSLMVKIAEDTHGEMIYYKGGAVSASEIGEALSRGVRVTIVTDPRIAPNAAKVAKKLVKDPSMVVDGTAELVRDAASHPTLRVIGQPNALPLIAFERILSDQAFDILSAEVETLGKVLVDKRKIQARWERYIAQGTTGNSGEGMPNEEDMQHAEDGVRDTIYKIQDVLKIGKTAGLTGDQVDRLQTKIAQTIDNTSTLTDLSMEVERLGGVLVTMREHLAFVEKEAARETANSNVRMFREDAVYAGQSAVGRTISELRAVISIGESSGLTGEYLEQLKAKVEGAITQPAAGAQTTVIDRPFGGSHGNGATGGTPPAGPQNPSTVYGRVDNPDERQTMGPTFTQLLEEINEIREQLGSRLPASRTYIWQEHDNGMLCSSDRHPRTEESAARLERIALSLHASSLSNGERAEVASIIRNTLNDTYSWPFVDDRLEGVLESEIKKGQTIDRPFGGTHGNGATGGTPPAGPQNPSTVYGRVDTPEDRQTRATLDATLAEVTRLGDQLTQEYEEIERLKKMIEQAELSPQLTDIDVHGDKWIGEHWRNINRIEHELKQIVDEAKRLRSRTDFARVRRHADTVTQRAFGRAIDAGVFSRNFSGLPPAAELAASWVDFFETTDIGRSIANVGRRAVSAVGEFAKGFGQNLGGIGLGFAAGEVFGAIAQATHMGPIASMATVLGGMHVTTTAAANVGARTFTDFIERTVGGESWMSLVRGLPTAIVGMDIYDRVVHSLFGENGGGYVGDLARFGGTRFAVGGWAMPQLGRAAAKSLTKMFMDRVAAGSAGLLTRAALSSLTVASETAIPVAGWALFGLQSLKTVKSMIEMDSPDLPQLMKDAWAVGVYRAHLNGNSEMEQAAWSAQIDPATVIDSDTSASTEEIYAARAYVDSVIAEDALKAREQLMGVLQIKMLQYSAQAEAEGIADEPALFINTVLSKMENFMSGLSRKVVFSEEEEGRRDIIMEELESGTPVAEILEEFTNDELGFSYMTEDQAAVLIEKIETVMLQKTLNSIAKLQPIFDGEGPNTDLFTMIEGYSDSDDVALCSSATTDHYLIGTSAHAVENEDGTISVRYPDLDGVTRSLFGIFMNETKTLELLAKISGME